MARTTTRLASLLAGDARVSDRDLHKEFDQVSRTIADALQRHEPVHIDKLYNRRILAGAIRQRCGFRER